MTALAVAGREGRAIRVRGTVQGVGFRPWVWRLARELRLDGRVRNDAGGVEIEAFGDPAALDALVRRLGREAPPAAVVESVEARALETAGSAFEAGFAIEASAEAGPRRVSIPPDLATCPRCAAEIVDPADRRFGYAFTSCTDCGPRFTIVTGVPYDRARTTMAGFAMCPECAAEYGDAASRRFHAQPNACPRCGPRLAFADALGRPLDVPDPLAAAARAIRGGLIVAVKGLGGYQLVCDAGDETAVATLRDRKRRSQKPFAVMVRDLPEAEEMAVLSAEERRLLTSVERPIVLARRRPSAALAPGVAPGLGRIGLFLPTTPLHQLLLGAVGLPVVATSGNLSDEPIACDDADAVARLGGREGRRIADRFLLHDREIAARCDDSVARLIAGRPTLLRRARGYVPRPIALRRPVARPVLAVGAGLKNAPCLVHGDVAVFAPHVGDLESVAACDAFDDAVERLVRFVGVAPEVVAHDLHPELYSTRWALDRGDLERVAVQHHHAHVASAIAEHGIDGPVFGLAWDGVGYGVDGAAWGGELLLADAGGCERLATFRALPLAGGDVAVREVWRLALALVDEAAPDLDPRELALFRAVAPERLEAVRRLLRSDVAHPRAHGVGRLFDAVGALVLARPEARYEGQVAALLEGAASPEPAPGYPFAVDFDAAPWQVDLRPMTRALVADLLAGASPGRIASAFHGTLASAAVWLLRRAAREGDRRPVVLTGGCFQNDLLVERILDRLGGEVEVYRHGEVPPGDGGLSLGQAVVADAVLGALAPSPHEGGRGLG